MAGVARKKHYRPAGKKKEGNAAKFITRSQAVKQLQVTLPVFRRLCILKGIFPRVPKKKVKGNHQTYYHTKDILFLRHEPLVEKLREQKAYDKKVKKALSKKNKERADRLLSRRPSYRLDRLILERYPRFIDALGDLDDCLTMVHLFAALPALRSEKVEVKRIHDCRRLSHEWQAYIARTHKLRKTFISVKGIYFQAEVDGQKITWIAPHRLQQVFTDDIDFSVMLTFLEFYETLLAFVNFRLYHSINVKYPPLLDPRLEASAADLYALSRYVATKGTGVGSQGVSSSGSEEPDSKKEDGSANESELRLAQLHHQLPSAEAGVLMHLVEDAGFEDDDDDETRECKSLFSNMKFFLSREVPRESLLFVISAFGGIVSWEGEGAPFEESDQDITYQIVDRPTQGHKFLAREYIQPQWVFDCVNARVILPTEDYLVGRIPPPHLSPFVDNEAEGYVPDYAEKIKRLQAAARKQVLPIPGGETGGLEDPQNLLVDGIIIRTEAAEVAEKKKKMQKLEQRYHEELKLELQGVETPTTNEKPGTAEDAGKREEEEVPEKDQVVRDTAEMDKLAMSRKKRGLVEAIEKSKRKKHERTELLKSRKRRILESRKSQLDKN